MAVQTVGNVGTRFCGQHVRRTAYVRLRIYGLALLAALSLPAGAASRPSVTAARCERAPLIDGKIKPGEWDSAAAVSNFVAADGVSTVTPNSVAYLMADDTTLYVAVRMLEPDPALPRGSERAHDDRIADDDSLRLYLAPEDLTQAKEAAISFGGYAGSFDAWYTDIKTYYEFAVNCKGSTGEARNDVRAWDAPWQARVGREKGAWIAEVAIPFASVGIPTCPANALWGFNLFRNRNSERSGMVNCYYGGYTPLPLGAICIGGPRPVVRQALTSTPQPGANLLEFVVLNPSAQATTVDVTIAGSVQPTVAVAAGASANVQSRYTLGSAGRLTAPYELRVSGETVPLLCGTVGVLLPPAVQSRLRYFSIPAEMRADITLAPGAEAARAVLSVLAGDAPETSAGEDLVGSTGITLRLPVVGKPGAAVSAKLTVLDAAGKVLDEQTCASVIPPHYAWQGTSAGLPLGLLPPWSPLTVSGKRIAIVGRTLDYSDSALPDAVNSAGAELLKEPLRLQVLARGKEVAWKTKTWTLLDHDDTHASIESLWSSARFDLRLTSEVEVDGFTWNEATLIPHGEQPLDAVTLRTTLTQETARLYCLGNSQEAGAISPVGLRCPFPVSYNLWVGNERHGLALLLESVEWLRTTDLARQVEILPGRTGAAFAMHVVDTPTRISQPYTMRFALHYTPAKPVSLSKSHPYHPMAEYNLPTAREASTMIFPASGNIDTACGTLECWLKPAFDTQETYDPAQDRSVYNRQLFTLVTSQSESLILYYNADTRNLVALRGNGAGAYPMILAGGKGRLAVDTWTYVALSWGDKVRLQVNDAVSEFEGRGSVAGSIATSMIQLNAAAFSIDDLRISRTQRPTGVVPAAAFQADSDTLMLHDFEDLDRPAKVAVANQPITANGCVLLPGRFGKALAPDPVGLHIDNLARSGVKIVIFHENWSRFQGYPDLAQVPKLKAVADACHARGMRFLIYFNQDMSDAAPEWRGLEYDFGLGGKDMNYRREYDEVKQNCYIACVNGPFGDLLLDGIAKIVDGAGIDGVYMDGTSVAWPCENPTHPGCGEASGGGKVVTHMPLRATRHFLKRLRNLFVQRGKDVYLSAHTGGAINVATTSLCDAYLDGEALSRFKAGYQLEPANFVAAYMGTNYGYRGEFLPGKFSADEALAIALVHDVESRWQPASVTRILDQYQDEQTRFVPYWEQSPLYRVSPAGVLASVYIRNEQALLVLGSQIEQATECRIDLSGVLAALPAGAGICNPITGEAYSTNQGAFTLTLPGRGWRLLEVGKQRTAERPPAAQPAGQ
jgi:hypothetical protein